MRLICLLVPVVLVPTAVLAQQPIVPVTAKNALYLEVFGNGGEASINFDRNIGPGVQFRVGWGSWGDDASTDFNQTSKSYNVFPVMLSAVLFPGNHHLELGGGMLVGRVNVDSTLINSTLSTSRTVANIETLLGYRRQPPGGGFVFRAGVTPCYSLQGDYPDSGLRVQAGVSAWGGPSSEAGRPALSDGRPSWPSRRASASSSASSRVCWTRRY